MNEELISVEELEKLDFKIHKNTSNVNGIDFTYTIEAYKGYRFYENSISNVFVYFNREYDKSIDLFTNNWLFDHIKVGDTFLTDYITTMQQLANLVFLFTGHPICEHKENTDECKYCFGHEWRTYVKPGRMVRFEYRYEYPVEEFRRTEEAVEKAIHKHGMNVAEAARKKLDEEIMKMGASKITDEEVERRR